MVMSKHLHFISQMKDEKQDLNYYKQHTVFDILAADVSYVAILPLFT